MLNKLDPLLHNQLRLGVMSLLIGVDDAEFKWLREETGSTAGNLSIQLKKLQDAGYIKIKKTFKGNYPHTRCRITREGVDAFESYVKALQSYIKK